MKDVAINLRSGHVIELNGKLWAVVKNEIMQPGKGASVSQIELRDIRTGNKDNVRFRTQEGVERVRLEQANYQYLYAEGDELHFMNQDNFEQITVKKDVIGDKAAFLQEGMIVEIESFETEHLGVKLPPSVILEIMQADPVIKGQTATTSYKPAILSNGVRVLVPPHIEAGTKIVVKTEDGSYVERAK